MSLSEESSGVWEGVRRALGRLVGSAHVREVPSERLAVTAMISSEAGLTGPPCRAGAQESLWPPTARVVAASAPRATAGAGGVELAAVATVIGMNAALRPEAVDTFAVPPLSASCTTHRLDDGGVGWASAETREAAVTLAPRDVRAADTRIAAPANRRLPLDPPALPRPERARGFGRRPPPADSWRLADVRVRAGMGVIADVPLTRSRRPAPGGPAGAEASLAERRRLAEASGVAPDDIVLLGVFPQVPVAAVRRLALAEGGGALSLWLKPEALAHAAAGKSPRLATLVIGRQRSTGRMLQTVT